MPAHCRMRAFDRDLIRGGHYGQRPRVPHLKAEHMAAPTNAANVKKLCPSSCTKQTSACVASMSAFAGKGGIQRLP